MMCQRNLHIRILHLLHCSINLIQHSKLIVNHLKLRGLLWGVLRLIGQRRVARFLDPEGAPGVGRADRPGIRDAYLLCLNGGVPA